MKASARMLLLWVMVVAMPVQGMAASLMLFCGPGHERMMQGLVAQDREAASMHLHDHPAEHHGHDHAAPGMGAGHEPSAQDAHHDNAAGPGSGLSHHAKGSCSACAACCSMLAIPVSFTLAGHREPAQWVPPPPAAPVRSHLPEALDRPPRTSFA